MTDLQSEDVASLVRDEIALITDATVRDALAQCLIPPERHVRNWDYSTADEQYPCWAIVKDSASDSAIVYSRHGHGPSSPWGIVLLSELWFGMDSGWFLRLEDAFVESFMAASLPIWDIVAPDGSATVSSVSLDEAFRRRDLLDASLPKPVHRVLYRSRHPEGVR